jgi:hypothetical protein
MRLIWTLLLCLVATVGWAADLDQYGGYKAVQFATGSYFRIVLDGDRYWLVTPDGYGFWMRAVYSLDKSTGGAALDTALTNKYGNSTTGQRHWIKRFKSWGFNAIGEYSLGIVHPCCVASINADYKAPFIRGPANVSFYGCGEGTPVPGELKDILNGITEATYSQSNDGGRFPDVFATGHESWAADYIGEARPSSIYNADLPTSPWMIGTTLDDTDYLRGLNGAPKSLFAGNSKKTPHLGYMALVTPPTQTTAGGDCGSYSYADTEVYTKTEISNWLSTRYSASIASLNTAWGSSYSGFGSNGGYGVGDGILDEDGQSAWLVGNDFSDLTGLDTDIRTDLDDFLYYMIDYYFGKLVGWANTYSPHLVFGNAPVNCENFAPVLQGIGNNVDVVQCTARPDRGMAAVKNACDESGKPVFVWLTFMASQDSTPNDFWGTQGDDNYDFATQEERGAGFSSYLADLTNLKDSDGNYCVVGFDWWSMTDKTAGGEDTNFGLVSNLDNAYDGSEDIIAAGTDSWDYDTGGEAGNYGDFLTAVIAAFQAQDLTLTTGEYGFTIKVDPGSTTAVVRYGWYAMGNVSCTSVIKTDPGGSTVDTVVQATGKSRRFAVHSGLSASTAYTANLTCNGYTYDALSFTTKAAGSGTSTYTYGSTPPSTLPTADTLALYCTDLDGGCSENCTVNTVNDEGCGSGCTLSSSGLGSGRTYECYHEWRDDHPGGNVLSTSPKFYWVTP